MSFATKDPTRLQYLEKKCSHREFYAAIASTAGIRGGMSDRFLERVVVAMNRGDAPLNAIPLREWGRFFPRPISANLGAAFRAHGDYATSAGLVCLAKEIARAQVESRRRFGIGAVELYEGDPKTTAQLIGTQRAENLRQWATTGELPGSLVAVTRNPLADVSFLEVAWNTGEPWV